MNDKYRSDYSAIYYTHILMDFFLMALTEQVCCTKAGLTDGRYTGLLENKYMFKRIHVAHCFQGGQSRRTALHARWRTAESLATCTCVAL